MTYTVIETLPDGRVNVLAVGAKTLEMAEKIAKQARWAAKIIDDGAERLGGENA